MKNKIVVISILAILGLMLIVLTGCGSSSNSITDKLNEIVKSSVDTWQEKEYAHTFTMSDLQSSLNDKGYKYIIIACGDSEFTNATTEKKFTENPSNYSGNAYSNTRGLESELTVNYCLVLDTEAQKYYNIEITYKTTQINGTDKEYPYFQNVKVVK